MNLIRILTERRELLWNLTSRELKQRYKGSALGFLWTVLTPLFMAAIYVFFLRLLAGRGVPIEEIIIGVFAWQYTTQCVTGGMNCVTGNGNLVKKVCFPREILPLSQVAANGIGYLLSLLVQFPLLALLLHFRGGLGFAGVWPLCVFWMFWQTLFNLGLALLLGALNVYFRDTPHLVGVGLSAWFFMSPVMYNMDFAANVASRWPWAVRLLYANPMAVIIDGYRSALLPFSHPGFPPVAWLGWGLVPVVLVLGLVTYRRLQKNFADLL